MGKQSQEAPGMEIVTARVQSTVTGYTAWALLRLAKKKGQSFANLGTYVLDRWVDENTRYLAGFGISQERFHRKVVDLND